MNGIGREIRYMEYKFRKKSGNGKSKNKSKHSGSQSFGDTTPYSDYNQPSSSIQNFSPDMKNALPKDKSEESIQIQVWHSYKIQL